MRSGSARTTITIERIDLGDAPARFLGRTVLSAKVAFGKYAHQFEHLKSTGGSIPVRGQNWQVVDVEYDSTNVFLPSLTVKVQRTQAERDRLGIGK